MLVNARPSEKHRLRGSRNNLRCLSETQLLRQHRADGQEILQTPDQNIVTFHGHEVTVDRGDAWVLGHRGEALRQNGIGVDELGDADDSEMFLGGIL